jgi:hypothetical protein
MQQTTAIANLQQNYTGKPISSQLPVPRLLSNLFKVRLIVLPIQVSESFYFHLGTGRFNSMSIASLGAANRRLSTRPKLCSEQMAKKC